MPELGTAQPQLVDIHVLAPLRWILREKLKITLIHMQLKTSCDKELTLFSPCHNNNNNKNNNNKKKNQNLSEWGVLEVWHLAHRLYIQFKDQHQNFKSESGVWHWRLKSCLIYFSPLNSILNRAIFICYWKSLGMSANSIPKGQALTRLNLSVGFGVKVSWKLSTLLLILEGNICLVCLGTLLKIFWAFLLTAYPRAKL